jgi:hypothetical protein
MVGEEMQRPTRVSPRAGRCRRADEVGFSLPVEFALVDTGGSPRGDSSPQGLGVTFPDASDRTRMAADGLTDLRISQAVIGVEKTSRTRENACFMRAGYKECLEFGSFVGRQIDNILLGLWHDVVQNTSEYYVEAFYEDKASSSGLKENYVL